MDGNTRVCPECGQDLSKLDAFAHSLTHWPEVLDPVIATKEARNRKQQLLSGGIEYNQYLSDHREG